MDMWLRRQNHLPLLIFHCCSSTHLRKNVSIPCMACLDLSVCACSSYMLHTHAYIFTTVLSVPSKCQARPYPTAVLKSTVGRVCMLIKCECVCWVGVGDGVGRKDTLTDPSLHPHWPTGILAVVSQQPLTVKTNTVFCKTLQLYVRYLLRKARIKWTDGRLGCP